MRRMNLGERVKYYREKKDWTLQNLSDASGVKLGTLGALEKNKRARSKYAGEIAKAFGLTYEQLISDEDWLDGRLSESALPALPEAADSIAVVISREDHDLLAELHALPGVLANKHRAAIAADAWQYRNTFKVGSA
jgi:transcriptional regulator with XRE-family HTH domain